MDVEKIQKINNLASDLLKQGLAENKDEAIAQAEKVFNGGSAKVKTQDANNQEEEVNKGNMNVKSNVRGYPDYSYDDQGGLSSDRIQDILERNTKYVVKMFKEFQGKISLMERKFSLIETELINLKKMLPATPIVEEVSQAPSIEISPANEVSSVQSTIEVDNNTNKNVPEKNDGEINETEGNNEITAQNNDSVSELKEPHPKVGRYNDEDVSIEKFFYMGSK